ncbi:MAG TPA: hypothetical protein VJ843_01650 [Candidatus Saccharimonadales bacterium]|nr:hypothetical protein [Candidatus Saccharimonadales bacterium]
MSFITTSFIVLCFLLAAASLLSGFYVLLFKGAGKNRLRNGLSLLGIAVLLTLIGYGFLAIQGFQSYYRF